MAVFFVAFITVFLAELGDKTQLVTLTLSTRFPPRQVLAGALTALAAITALAVVLGDFLAGLLPHETTMLFSGLLFLIMGAWMAFKQGDKDEEIKGPSHGVAVKTFALVFVAELGDKTQLAAIALTATYGAPLMVFLGAMAGQLLNHGLAAYLGSRYLNRLPRETVKIAASLLFIFFGALFIYSGLR